MAVLPIVFNVYVDWNDDDTFGAAGWADANEDVSSEVLAVSWSRGRNTPHDDFGTGTATVVLENTSGDYNPFDSGAATWPNMKPGRRVKIEAVHNSVTYPVFGGHIAEISQQITPDRVPTTTLKLRDGFDRMSRGQYSIDYPSSAALPSALVLTIALVNDWPSYPVPNETDLDASVSASVLYPVTRKDSPLATAKLFARHEMGGQLFCANDGKWTFRNRNYRSDQDVAFTLTGPQVIDAAIRQSDYYDEIIATGGITNIDTSNSVVYKLNTQITGRAIGPGTSDPRNKIEGTYNYAADSAVTPVAGTDYTANALADGTGEDVTNKVSVDSFTGVDSGFTLVFDNETDGDVYITKLEVRALAMSRSAEELAVSVTNASPVISGQVLREEFPFSADLDLLKGWAQMKSAALNATGIPPRIVVKMNPRDDTEAADYLGAEISDRITVTNTTGAYPSQLNDDFFVERIRGRSVKGQYVDLTLDLWHKEMAGGNFFKISGTAASGNDNSQIVGAAATTGDRIAF